MNRKRFATGVSASVAAAVVAGPGGYCTRAAAQPGAVNAPEARNSLGTSRSFAEIVQRVAPAVVSIDVLQKAKPSPTVAQGPGGDGGTKTFVPVEIGKGQG